MASPGSTSDSLVGGNRVEEMFTTLTTSMMNLQTEVGAIKQQRNDLEKIKDSLEKNVVHFTAALQHMQASGTRGLPAPHPERFVDPLSNLKGISFLLNAEGIEHYRDVFNKPLNTNHKAGQLKSILGLGGVVAFNKTSKYRLNKKLSRLYVYVLNEGDFPKLRNCQPEKILEILGFQDGVELRQDGTYECLEQVPTTTVVFTNFQRPKVEQTEEERIEEAEQMSEWFTATHGMQCYQFKIRDDKIVAEIARCNELSHMLGTGVSSLYAHTVSIFPWSNFHDLQFCYGCYGIGHVKSDPKCPGPRCGWCGASGVGGHTVEDCPKKKLKTDKQCPNCTDDNTKFSPAVPTDHAAWERECTHKPTVLERLAVLQRREGVPGLPHHFKTSMRPLNHAGADSRKPIYDGSVTRRGQDNALANNHAGNSIVPSVQNLPGQGMSAKAIKKRRRREKREAAAAAETQNEVSSQEHSNNGRSDVIDHPHAPPTIDNQTSIAAETTPENDPMSGQLESGGSDYPTNIPNSQLAHIAPRPVDQSLDEVSAQQSSSAHTGPNDTPLQSVPPAVSARPNAVDAQDVGQHLSIQPSSTQFHSDPRRRQDTSVTQPPGPPPSTEPSGVHLFTPGPHVPSDQSMPPPPTHNPDHSMDLNISRPPHHSPLPPMNGGSVPPPYYSGSPYADSEPNSWTSGDLPSDFITSVVPNSAYSFDFDPSSSFGQGGVDPHEASMPVTAAPAHSQISGHYGASGWNGQVDGYRKRPREVDETDVFGAFPGNVGTMELAPITPPKRARIDEHTS